MNTTTIPSPINTLVLGATGSIGYAVTANLLARRLPVTILVRNRAKASALFPDADTLTIVEGDAQDADLLNQTAANKTHIFHGINYPYNEWYGNMDAVTKKVIDAAAFGANGKATIVFPGNVYNFGNTRELIREDSLPDPNTRKGKLRVDLETSLEQAAGAGQCRVLNVRLPDFWGPNVLNAGVRPIFENALTGKALPWLLTADIPHQAVYTADAAEIIVRLMLQPGTSEPYTVWNYGGTTHTSIRSWFGQISALTGHPPKVQVHGRFILSALGLIMPVMREVKEMLYLYENTVLLDDRRVRTLFPDFRETPMEQALTDTLTWFAEHQLKRTFTPAVSTLGVA
jgi:nucleoside-diphosphate-sugar epimerase